MDPIATLVKSIFQKESLHDCSVEELQTIARQYSYFIPAQLLLAEKLKSANESLYKEQIQKLSLHFNNPLWLDYLLNGYQEEIIVEPGREATSKESQEKTETPGEQPFIKTESEIFQPVNEEVSEPLYENLNAPGETTEIGDREENIQSSDEHFVKSVPAIPGLVEEETKESTHENLNVFDEATRAEDQQENIQLSDGHFIKSEPEISEPVKEEINVSLNENLNALNETAGIEDRQENIQSPAEHFIKSEPEIVEPVKEEVHEPLPENHFDEATATAEQQENMEIQNQEVLVNGVSESEITVQSDRQAGEAEISLPSLPDLKEDPAETELTFEPYHTVDYFASQGIRFIPEEKPADRFGQQLKSFTEWLRIMKRLPQAETIKVSDPSSEEKVQQLADHSVSAGEVVTEAMAEVWLKQGNREKAIETYHKLSLINPAKSHYFAAKIEQLKNS